MRSRMQLMFTIVFIGIVCSLAGCSLYPQKRGILAGRVSVGPLTPVVGPGVVEPTPGPQVYAGRKIVVFDSRGKRELQQVDIMGDGTYRVELEVGIYVIDINHMGIDYDKDLPATVEIQADQMTVLDIDIDTGIR